MTEVLERPIRIETAPQVRARAQPRASRSAEARALIRLAAPLIASQLAQMAVMTTDVFMLGRYSKTALASAAIGGTIYYAAWVLGAGPPAAVAPMIAQALGRRSSDRAGVRQAVRMGLWAVALAAPVLMTFMWFARPLLLALHQNPVLAAGAGQFVSMLSFGLPFSIAFMVLRNFATAVERPRATLYVTAATIGWNALADWALIFGHFGAPRLGIIGSGLATSSSAIFSFAAMLTVVAFDKRLRAFRIFRRFWRFSTEKLGEVVHLGMPIGMTALFEAMYFNVMTLVVGTFGPDQVAAHQIAMNVASITFMVPLGIGMAATVRVGMAAGRDDVAAARLAGTTAIGLGVGFMAVCGLLLGLFSRQAAGLYFGGAAAVGAGGVLALAALFLKAAAAFQVFDAAQVIGALSLRGLKDARMPMVLAGGAYWLAGAPTCIFLAYGLGLRGLGVWIGFVVGLAVAAVLMSWRFARLTRRRG
ncbi:MAG TPA: MATE family efflux transporter [Caulobacteraceae bacterium]|nr:MATE family efflux transporter [Caulobacteraceae bacterium]